MLTTASARLTRRRAKKIRRLRTMRNPSNLIRRIKAASKPSRSCAIRSNDLRSNDYGVASAIPSGSEPVAKGEPTTAVNPPLAPIVKAVTVFCEGFTK